MFKVFMGGGSGQQWGRTLERWPNTAACLAGWRVTQQGLILYVRDGPCRLPWLALTDHLSRSGADLFLKYTKHRHELRHARKAWLAGTLVDLTFLSGRQHQFFPNIKSAVYIWYTVEWYIFVHFLLYSIHPALWTTCDAIVPCIPKLCLLVHLI
jgi:hypothetical protein